jgi:hypothetical protein
MVKSKLKAEIPKKSKIKRFRGIKSGINSKNNKNLNKRKESKPFDKNYYLKGRINFLDSEFSNTINNLLTRENNEFKEDKVEKKELNYKEEDRFLVLLGLKDIITKICETNKEVTIPDKFTFSVISLFDSCLDKFEKQLNKKDMVKVLYACMSLIDKEQNIGVFTSPCFQKYINPDIEMDILEIVDLNIYPVEIYDFFNVFLFRIKQIKKDDIPFLDYIKKFERIFCDFGFFLLFHKNSKIKKPSINFLSCFILTYDTIKKMLSQENDFIEKFINYIKNELKISEDENTNCEPLVKESILIYKNILNKVNCE